MTRMLVSVMNVAEALAAAGAGADFIDLKDPAAGALGGLAPATIVAIVAVLRDAHPGLRISATIGDVDVADRAEILARVAAVAVLGVDYVKVGIESAEAPAALLDALAHCGASVVPVLIVDRGVDLPLVEQALALGAFPALMLDTAEKQAGSLLVRVHPQALRAFIAMAREHGTLSGMAGALRAADVPRLRELAPDFVGFRSAVCSDHRAGALEAARVRELKHALAEPMPLPATQVLASAFNARVNEAFGSNS